MSRKVLFGLGIILGACASSATGLADGSLREISTSTNPGELTANEFDRIKIDGMDCIVWKDERGQAENRFAYSGLTCNWPPR